AAISAGAGRTQTSSRRFERSPEEGANNDATVRIHARRRGGCGDSARRSRSRRPILAGGTTQLDLMLKDGVLEPGRLVDITRLPLRGITFAEDTLRVGALVTMEELAADPTVSERLPFVREALLAGASAQLRNLAPIGWNLL